MPRYLKQLAQFASVGGVGFVIDGSILLALVVFGMNPFYARLVSFPFAAVATWWLNRIWTFRDRTNGDARHELGEYLVVQLFGALANYGCYSLVLSMFGMSAIVTMLALCAGSFFAFLCNFIGARYLVFKK